MIFFSVKLFVWPHYYMIYLICFDSSGLSGCVWHIQMHCRENNNWIRIKTLHVIKIKKKFLSFTSLVPGSVKQRRKVTCLGRECQEQREEDGRIIGGIFSLHCLISRQARGKTDLPGDVLLSACPTWNWPSLVFTCSHDFLHEFCILTCIHIVWSRKGEGSGRMILFMFSAYLMVESGLSKR